MGYESLFAPCDLAMLYDWLSETGELYLDLDRPHSGGSKNSLHFVRNLAELRVIISNETWPEIDISIFRAKQYPIRGFADDKLLATATEQIPDGEYFTILSVGADPLAPCGAIGWGSGHRELREELPGSKDDKFGLDKIPSICLPMTTLTDSSTVPIRC
jgi:hypothetical protein